MVLTDRLFLSAVLAVFLWPLITSPEVGLWLEPVLQKLDLGVRDVLQKIKQNHGNKEDEDEVCPSRTSPVISNTSSSPSRTENVPDPDGQGQRGV